MACDAPLAIKFKQPVPDGKGGWLYYFPGDCGRCLPCLKKRKAQWSYRIENEMKHAITAYFVTLTYNDDNLPPGNMVVKEHHKTFIELLKLYESWPEMSTREDYSYEEYIRASSRIGEYSDDYTYDSYPLRYYGVVEFGGTTGRVHWHYLLFNVLDKRNIEKAWQAGMIQIDPCNINTIDYVLKYMIKDRENDLQEEKRERSFMSKGIGMQGITQEFIDSISEPENNQVINSRGFKVALPRIFRKNFMEKSQLEAKAKAINEAVAKQKKELEDKTRELGLDPAQNEVVAKQIRQNKLKEAIKRRSKI